jgi:hypothetical protein
MVMQQLGYHSTLDYLMQQSINISDINFIKQKQGFNASGACLDQLKYQALLKCHKYQNQPPWVGYLPQGLAQL